MSKVKKAVKAETVKKAEKAGKTKKAAKMKKIVIAGVNPVAEALKAGRNIKVIYSCRDLTKTGCLKRYAELNSVPVKTVSKEYLNSLYPQNQGVVAVAEPFAFVPFDELLKKAFNKNTPAFIIICDRLEDPRNFGAVIRTAHCVGADGIIIKNRGNAPISAAVYKTSAGALNYTDITRVSNLNQCVKQLQKAGVWVYGASMEGQSAYETDLTVPLALVLGGESKGISPLLKKNCDRLISVPIKGEVDSLNVSAAAAVLMYEAVRQRDLK